MISITFVIGELPGGCVGSGVGLSVGSGVGSPEPPSVGSGGPGGRGGAAGGRGGGGGVGGIGSVGSVGLCVGSGVGGVVGLSVGSGVGSVPAPLWRAIQADLALFQTLASLVTLTPAGTLPGYGRELVQTNVTLSYVPVGQTSPHSWLARSCRMTTLLRWTGPLVLSIFHIAPLPWPFWIQSSQPPPPPPWA